VKIIQKQPLPDAGCNGYMQIPHGARVVGIGYENQQLFAYVEQAAWAAGTVYWDVQTVREGESYGDGHQFIGMTDDARNPGAKLFIVGRING
jgi:hypothetical protein